MANIILSRGEEFLRDAAVTLFEEKYGQPSMHFGKELHRDLHWTPAARFVIYGYINVFVEPSETGPYPRILDLKYADVLHFQEPVSIYIVCREEMIATATQRTEMKRLQNHGHGLVIVDSGGRASRVFSPTPLVQVISQAEFRVSIKGLPKTMRQRASEAFDEYQSHPVNGVKSLSEIVEGLVQGTAKQAIAKGYISGVTSTDPLGRVLSKMQVAQEFRRIQAEVGAVRVYVRECRNLSHHWPRSRKKAYEKYVECRHAFLEGTRHLRRFREAVKGVGLTGNLPRL